MKFTGLLAMVTAVTVVTPATAAVRVTGDFREASFDVTMDSFLGPDSSVRFFRYDEGATITTKSVRSLITYVDLNTLNSDFDRVQLVTMEPDSIIRAWSYDLPKGALSRAGTDIVGTQHFSYTGIFDKGTLTLVDLAAPVASAVPEPATWTMLLMGFASVGMMLRYRRRHIAVRFG